MFVWVKIKIELSWNEFNNTNKSPTLTTIKAEGYGDQ